MKSVQVDSIIGHYRVLANYHNAHLLAVSVVAHDAEPYAVLNVGGDGRPYGGSYFGTEDSAQQEFCERCFGDWFQPSVDVESLLVDRQDFETHWTARYHGWLLAQRTDSEDAYVLCFLPNAEWAGSILPDFEYLTDTYDIEWEADTIQGAMDFIDIY